MLHGHLASRRWNLAQAIIAGGLLGLACLGRQTYLVTLIALPFLFHRGQNWFVPVVVALFTLITCGWLFWLWHGFVPPGAAHVSAQLDWSHGILSFSYLAAATLFISPSWLLWNKTSAKRDLIVLYSIGLGAGFLALAYPFAEITPAHTLMKGNLPPFVFSWYSRMMSAVFVSLAAVWITRFSRDVWTNRSHSIWLFLYLSLLALALMPVKISHQFSSRYVVTDIGLLVLIVSREAQALSLFFLVRLGAGTILGALVLHTYLSQ
jgi:hypothetical protein